MLHTKFRGNLPDRSGEEDFWRVFTIYGRGGHLGHVTQMPRTNFPSPYPKRLHIKFGFDWPSGFREEDVWNCERRRTTTDGRTPDHGYTISSPLSLRLRWAKKPVLSFICYWLWVKVKKWPWPSILTYLHNFMPFQVTQAAKVLKNQQFSIFPIEKP